MQIILIPGLWLDASIWDDVAAALTQQRHRARALSLPGQGGTGPATLQGQLNAAVRAVDDADGQVLLVGHSAASTLAWMVADRRPDRIHRVLMISGFPASPGRSYAAFFDAEDGRMPFPGWQHFEGPDSADLDAESKKRLEAAMHPMPTAVTSASVEYESIRRFTVPVTLVCPEYTAEDARGWVEGGDLPELREVKDLRYADIGSGHWPMVSKPKELADLIVSWID